MDTKVTVFDLEADGLLDEATRIWCGVVDDVAYEPHQIEALILKLANSDIICGHNIIDYDLPLLEKIYEYKHEGKVLDTLVLSRLLNPERQGGHSLDVWGQRVGVQKPVHEDWSMYSEEMLHRCKEDVKINRRVYDLLLREAELNAEDLEGLPVYRTT